MTDKTREAFEAHCSKYWGGALHIRDMAGSEKFCEYVSDRVQFAWLAYQDATARAAAEAVRVPDGWQLVPKTHTMDMSVAFAEAFYSRARTVDDDDISDWWDALIAAAPQPKEAL